MRLILTGIYGGIGSTLARFLISKGHSVIGIDNLSNGYRENLKDIEVLVYENSILDTNKLVDIFQKNQIDAVIHLAALTSLPECEQNPFKCYENNTLGTLSVLEAARKSGITKFVFASTSAVYENNYMGHGIPFTETLNVNPTLSYSLSKRLAEDICNSYRDKYGMQIAILRYFNVFGPRQDFYRKSPPLINYITREIINGRVPILHSDGKQSRDYVYVDDICKATLISLEKGNDTYNVCSGTLISVNEIYDIISKVLDFKEPAIFNPPENLWKDYNISLNKDRIKKETEKFSLGDNEKIVYELGMLFNSDIKGLIAKTALEIKKLYGK